MVVVTLLIYQINKSMKEYFKPRARFKQKEHAFDIGRAFSWWKGHYDRHFLNSLHERSENEFDAFYRYHLDYFLKANEGAAEAEFFKHVWDIAGDELAVLIKDDKRHSRSKHERNNIEKIQLRAFTEYLKSIDQWNTGKAKDEIIAAKEEEIKILNEQLAAMKQELKAARKLETEDYINITSGYRNTVLDLYLQLQEIKMPDGKELLLSQTQSVWMKMICKYFREGDQEINFETIRRYFPGDKREPGFKHSPIPAKSKLFQISPVKNRN